MTRYKTDVITDLAYYSAFVIDLILFVISLTGLIDSDLTPAVSEREAVWIVLDDACEVVCTALFSVALFSILLCAVVIVHELGHVLGGLVKGYRIAHFCVFGLVISPRGRRLIQFDRTALFGGYAVMLSPERNRSPLFLLRAGPWAECVFLSMTSGFILIGLKAAVIGEPLLCSFLLGEIVAFLFVRIVSLGTGGSDDTSTAAQVICDGPGDYNRLMDIYDKQINEVTLRLKVSEKTGMKTGKKKRKCTRKEVLTIKEELSLYAKE